MINIVATIKVLPGKGPDLEAAFRATAAEVRATEPGCIFYHLAKSRSEPDTYKVLEGYKDQAAVDTHMKNNEARPPNDALGACLAGPPTLEILDEV